MVLESARRPATAPSALQFWENALLPFAVEAEMHGPHGSELFELQRQHRFYHGWVIEIGEVEFRELRHFGVPSDLTLYVFARLLLPVDKPGCIWTPASASFS